MPHDLLQVNRFDTVEDFWATLNHIEDPGKLRNGCDYSLFKSGIEPMWEDPANQSGGRWIISLENADRMQKCNGLW